MDNLATIIEGILYSANQPMTAEHIIKVFPEDERPAIGEVRKVLGQIQEWYAPRGVHLVEVASGYRFQVTTDVAPFIQRTLEEKPQKYSRALLETLALIAYRQPITRAEIEDIRGVAVSTNIVRTLSEQGWVRVIGHKEVPGRPALYATTKGFLDHFGLAHLEELPPLAELKDLNAIDPNLAQAAQDEEAGIGSEQSDENVDENAEKTAEDNTEIAVVEATNSEDEAQEQIDIEAKAAEESGAEEIRAEAEDEEECSDIDVDENEFEDDDLPVLG